MLDPSCFRALVSGQALFSISLEKTDTQIDWIYWMKFRKESNKIVFIEINPGV